MKTAMMKVDVHGADVPLSFVCTVKEELSKCSYIQCVLVCVMYLCRLVDACILCMYVLFTAHATVQLFVRTLQFTLCCKPSN